MRKPGYAYRYSVGVEAHALPTHRTDDLARAIRQARIEHSVSVRHGRGLHYTVYDYVDLRVVFSTRELK